MAEVGGRASNGEFYPVIIVGGGPTGLTLGNLLSRYGTRALLIERNTTTVQEPRAVSIDDESLRTMQAFGAAETVASRMAAGYGSEYYSPSKRLFLKVGPSEEPYGYPRRNAFRQPIFEAQLREHLEASHTVDALFGWTLVKFNQDDEQVTVWLEGPDKQQRVIYCDFLVGADGASSSVRTALGLTVDGETFKEKWLIVDLENSPAQSRDTIVFCDTRRPCIALPGPDLTRRFEFKLLPGEKPEEMVEDLKVQTLLRNHGAAPESRIARKTVYTFHARLAPRWSSGRVYLAGDACHLTPPFAGQGMNSGIRDAHNLAWKLAWVSSGKAKPSLLDSYEQERRGHVGEMIELALRMGRIMAPVNALHGFLTRASFHLLGLWPAARDYFAQMKYKPKPRFALGFIAPDERPTRETTVGRLLPQPKVATASREVVALDQLLGNGFALVAVTDDTDGLMRAKCHFAACGIDVEAIAMSSQTTSAKGESGVITAGDPSDTILAAAYGLSDRVLVIRPDRYIYSTFSLQAASQAAAQLADALGIDAGIETRSIDAPLAQLA